MLSMLCLAGELAEVTLQSLESLHGDSTAQWLYRLARGCDTEEVCTSHHCTDHQLAQGKGEDAVHLSQLTELYICARVVSILHMFPPVKTRKYHQA